MSEKIDQDGPEQDNNGGASAADTVETEEGRADLPCNPTCPPSAITWAIPAGILNAFWTDIYPRLVAQHWENTPGTDNLVPGINAAGLIQEINALPATNPNWIDRRNAVIKHFDVAQTTGQIPFEIVGTGGFDFLLSDSGLDLFVPEEPHTPSEMLQFYTFRRTGRPAIGLYDYLANGMSAVSIDSPTGPSQIRVNANAVLRKVRGSGPKCEEEVRCLELWLERQRRPEESSNHDPTQEERYEIILHWQAYRCMLEHFRCWQLEGAVYRGLMSELPRVVATMWLEEERDPLLADGYRDRVRNGVKGGLRTLLAERLETSLPDPLKMEFKLHPPVAIPPVTVPPWNWDNDDVMITNQGFFFPEPAVLHAFLDATLLNNMVRAIMTGTAGNPVFTDSKRTML